MHADDHDAQARGLSSRAAHLPGRTARVTNHDDGYLLVAPGPAKETAGRRQLESGLQARRRVYQAGSLIQALGVPLRPGSLSASYGYSFVPAAASG